MTQPIERNIPATLAFLRAQTAAVVATALDFMICVLLVELFAVWYVAASATGALYGALANFLLGRHWCFDASDGAVFNQASRYFLVSATSLMLNTSGVYLLTDVFAFHYMTSKTLVAISVAVFFNFPLQRNFVFKKA